MFQILDQQGAYPCPRGELSILLTSDPEIAAIHETYLQDPTPTDVITFPGDPDQDFAGEIIVSIDTALNYINNSHGDLSSEIALYLVHGYLHLCGWDDSSSTLRKAMKEAEKSAMLLLEQSNALPSFSLPHKKISSDKS